MLTIRTANIGGAVATGTMAVTREMTTSYAAAIGADSYLDANADDHLIAPAGFIHVVEWPVMRGAEHLAALGVPETDLFRHLLHAFHDTSFTRPIRPGDLLSVTATFAAARQTGTGVLTTTRLTTVDGDRQPVSESWFGAFFRGATLDGPDREAFKAPSLGRQDYANTSLTMFDNRRDAATIYSACSGLWNPIHTERKFAQDLGLRDIAMHGSYAWSRCCEHLIEQKRPAKLLRFAARFSAVLHPGDTTQLNANANLTSFELTNQAGEKILSHGLAIFADRGQGSALNPQEAEAL